MFYELHYCSVHKVVFVNNIHLFTQLTLLVDQTSNNTPVVIAPFVPIMTSCQLQRCAMLLL